MEFELVAEDGGDGSCGDAHVGGFFGLDGGGLEGPLGGGDDDFPGLEGEGADAGEAGGVGDFDDFVGEAGVVEFAGDAGVDLAGDLAVELAHLVDLGGLFGEDGAVGHDDEGEIIAGGLCADGSCGEDGGEEAGHSDGFTHGARSG